MRERADGRDAEGEREPPGWTVGVHHTTTQLGKFLVILAFAMAALFAVAAFAGALRGEWSLALRTTLYAVLFGGTAGVTVLFWRRATLSERDR